MIALNLVTSLLSFRYHVYLWSARKESGLSSSFNRTTIRQKYGIPGTWFGDCCVQTWCGPCALAQEARTVATFEEAAEAVCWCDESTAHKTVIVERIQIGQNRTHSFKLHAFAS